MNEYKVAIEGPAQSITNELTAADAEEAFDIVRKDYRKLYGDRDIERIAVEPVN